MQVRTGPESSDRVGLGAVIIESVPNHQIQSGLGAGSSKRLRTGYWIIEYTGQDNCWIINLSGPTRRCGESGLGMDETGIAESSSRVGTRRRSSKYGIRTGTGCHEGFGTGNEVRTLGAGSSNAESGWIFGAVIWIK